MKLIAVAPNLRMLNVFRSVDLSMSMEQRKGLADVGVEWADIRACCDCV